MDRQERDTASWLQQRQSMLLCDMKDFVCRFMEKHNSVFSEYVEYDEDDDEYRLWDDNTNTEYGKFVELVTDDGDVIHAIGMTTDKDKPFEGTNDIALWYIDTEYHTIQSCPLSHIGLSNYPQLITLVEMSTDMGITYAVKEVR